MKVCYNYIQYYLLPLKPAINCTLWNTGYLGNCLLKIPAVSITHIYVLHDQSYFSP